MPGKSKLSSFVLPAILGLSMLLYLLPFFLVIVNSLKSRKDIILNPIGLPATPLFSNFVEAATRMNYLHGFINSLIITTASVAVILIFSSMTAWVLVRRNWLFGKIFFMSLVAAMIIPFQAIMIPLVKIYGSVGMLNSKASLVYLYLGFGTALAVFMYHGFMKSIPLELEEAALIDGASRFQMFWLIVFPILKPITVTIGILDVLWIWNDFLLPSLVLIHEKNRTLPLSTFYFSGTYTVDYGLAMAGLMLSILPVIILYLFMQKQIIKGVLQGSIK